MERRTRRNEDGIAFVEGVDASGYKTVAKGPTIELLAAYEDTGLKPEEIAAVADAIEKLQASLLKWYSVSEPPKRNGRYLVAYEDSVSFLDYFNGKWFFPPRNGIVVEETKESVLYWMPLPAPPKEGDK